MLVPLCFERGAIKLKETDTVEILPQILGCPDIQWGGGRVSWLGQNLSFHLVFMAPRQSTRLSEDISMDRSQRCRIDMNCWQGCERQRSTRIRYQKNIHCWRLASTVGKRFSTPRVWVGARFTPFSCIFPLLIAYFDLMWQIRHWGLLRFSVSRRQVNQTGQDSFKRM